MSGLLLLGTACGLINGASDLTTAPDLPDVPEGAPAADAGPPSDATSGSTDADTTTDDGGDASRPCVVPPPVANTSGALSALRAPGAVVIDGQLDEWSCVPFTRLDRASAGQMFVSGDSGTPADFAMEFAVTYDSDALYVAARVSGTAPPAGDAPTAIFKNDSIEIYLDADGVLTGRAGPNDHQLVVDHANREERYVVMSPPASPTAVPVGFASAARTVGGVLSVEARLPGSTLGKSSLAAGDKLGFDIAVNDGDGTGARTQAIWYAAPGCTCTVGCCCGAAQDMPFCNTQRYGSLTLAP